MSKDSFKINKALTLGAQSGPIPNPTDGDIYYRSVTGIAHRNAGFWDNLTSTDTLASSAVLSSTQFSTTLVENSLVSITGSTESLVVGLSPSATGKKIFIVNDTDQTVTLANESITEVNPLARILAPNAADLQIPPSTAAQLFYTGTRWKVISQPANNAGGLKNYLPKGNAEAGVYGQNYNDGSSVPVDGSGGSFTGTFVASNSLPLAGTKSYIYTPGANVGNGHSFDFTIDREDTGQALMINFSYELTGTYSTGSLSWYVIDLSSNQVIIPWNNEIINATGIQQSVAIFYSNENSLNYRLCLHQTDASIGYTMKFEVAVNPRTSTYFSNVLSPQQAGFMQEWGGTTDPDGWLVCDGRELSRGQYPDLFAAIGTRYGAGDGLTTFNIPDLRGQFVRGSLYNIPPGIQTGDGSAVSGNTLNFPAHGLTTGLAVYVITNTGLSGVTAATRYFAIVSNINQIRLASSRANAFSGTAVAITGTNNATIIQDLDRDASSRTAYKSGGATGSTPGSFEQDELRNHSHQFPAYDTPASANTAAGGNGTQVGTVTTSETGGSETRPSNISVNYIIKVYSDNLVAVTSDKIPYDQEVGFIFSSGSNYVGRDYLYCNGASVAVASYPQLFARIGYTFGGSGAFFNIPDGRGAFLRGIDDTPNYNFTGSASSNNLTTTTTHSLRTGQKVRFVSVGTLSGVSIGVTYYAINISSNLVAFATSPTNAISNTKIAITGAVGGAVLQSYEDPDRASRYASSPGGSAGNSIGARQIDEVGSHTHLIEVPQFPVQTGTWLDAAGGNTTNRLWGNSNNDNSRPTAPTGSTGGNETRPSNMLVKFYIRARPASLPASVVEQNSGVDQVVPALDLDWGAYDTFYKDVAVNSTFTFSNISNGKSIVLAVRNSGASSVNISFPAGIIYNPASSLTVDPGEYSVFTFVRTNNLIFLSVIDGMT